jgi:hypothetical protein
MSQLEVAEAVEQWNTAAREQGWMAVRMLTPERFRRARQIIQKGFWEEGLAKAKASDFLCGRSKRGPEHEEWRLTFDTFTRPSFFARLIDGNYDNRTIEGIAGAVVQMSTEDLQWRARLRGFEKSSFWLPNWGPRPGSHGCMVPPHLLTH